MDVLPRRRTVAPTRKQADRPVNPAVSWIAIVIGVFLAAVGVLLLLWGLSWQGTSEDNDPLDPDTSVGGPVLFPLGVFVIAIGMIWILNGYKVFGRKRAESRSCPRCGRSVETDLAFCYHCGAEIPEERPRKEARPPTRR
jgi:ribosomal protein S27AE